MIYQLVAQSQPILYSITRSASCIVSNDSFPL